MIAVAVVALLLAGFVGAAHQIHRIGFTCHRDHLRREWADADRREHRNLEEAESAARRGDLASAASFKRESEMAAEQKRELENLLGEVQRFLGEPPENAVGPAAPKL
jgi:hypothetical protein